jgi:hypothetical protein
VEVAGQVGRYLAPDVGLYVTFLRSPPAREREGHLIC